MLSSYVREWLVAFGYIWNHHWNDLFHFLKRYFERPFWLFKSHHWNACLRNQTIESPYLRSTAYSFVDKKILKRISNKFETNQPTWNEKQNTTLEMVRLVVFGCPGFASHESNGVQYATGNSETIEYVREEKTRSQITFKVFWKQTDSKNSVKKDQNKKPTIGRKETRKALEWQS